VPSPTRSPGRCATGTCRPGWRPASSANGRRSAPGRGSFADAAARHIPACLPRGEDRPVLLGRYAHNDYLQALAERGLLGLGALLAAIGLHARSAAARWRHPAVRTQAKAQLLWALPALAALLTHALVHYPLQAPTTFFHFWFLLGLCRVSARRGPERRRVFRRPLWYRALPACAAVPLLWAALCPLGAALAIERAGRLAAAGRGAGALAAARCAVGLYPHEPAIHLRAAQLALAFDKPFEAIGALRAGRERSGRTYPFDMALGDTCVSLAKWRAGERDRWLRHARGYYHAAAAARPDLEAPRHRLAALPAPNR